jgi:regulator of RNase E activity RraA
MILSYTMTATDAPGTDIPPDLARAVDQLRQISTATITTQLLARGLRNTFLRGPQPLKIQGERMVGPAFTLRYIPAREDIDVLAAFRDYDHPQRLAIESTPAGSVLVIDARGQTAAATLGNILATRFVIRGGEGIVTDGVVRDRAGFLGLTVSTFAAGASPTTNLAEHHAVDFDLPIACGGVAVYPGDIMMGDGDGVICIPRHLAVEVAEAGLQQEQTEEFVLAKIQEGRSLRGTYPPDAATLQEYEQSR